VGFVVDKVALGQVFSEYFGFPLSIFIPPIAPQSASPTTGPGTVASSGRSTKWTQSHITKNENKKK
jgi:hypothetical protein